jgi:hypothetical protein
MHTHQELPAVCGVGYLQRHVQPTDRCFSRHERGNSFGIWSRRRRELLSLGPVLGTPAVVLAEQLSDGVPLPWPDLQWTHGDECQQPTMRAQFDTKEAAQLRRPERFNMTTKIKEHMCEACMGTGYPVVMQPAQPGRKNLSCQVQSLRRQRKDYGR